MFGSLRLLVLPLLVTIQAADVSNRSNHTPMTVCMQRAAHLWQTSCDQSKLLERIPGGIRLDCNNSTAVDPAVKPDVEIRLEPSEVRQRIVGFGGALTASTAYVLNKAPKAVREGALKKLFGTLEENGAHLNFIRLVVGASDFSLPAGIQKPSYDEVQGDTGFSHFSIDKSPHDRDVLPILKKILARNRNATLLATPWTGPLWMKTDPTNGRGVLQDDYYKIYADYLVKYLRAYRAKGINITYLTLQNEPGHGYCGNEMPCMPMSAAQQTALGLWFESARIYWNLDTRLLAYDHNWDISWGEWLSAAGFYSLRFVPVWLLYGLMGLACGICVASSPKQRERLTRVTEQSNMIIKSSRLCSWWRRDDAFQQGGSQRKSSKMFSNASAPLLMAKDDSNLTLSSSRRVVDGWISAAGDVEGLNVGAKRYKESRRHLTGLSQFTSFNMSDCASQAAEAAEAFVGSNDPTARRLRSAIYALAGLLLFGRIAGLIAKAFAERFGYFDPEMGRKYPERMLQTPGADLVFHGVAWHCYGGDPSSMSTMYDKYPKLEQHVTECGGGRWHGNDWGSIIIQDSEWMFASLARHRANSIMRFNFALDENHGPSCGDSNSCCHGCFGMLTIPSDAQSMDNVTVGQDWYSLAHHSAFVQRDAQVIERYITSERGYEDYADAVAYRNPAGDLVAVVLNKKDLMQFRLTDGSTNQSFLFEAPRGLSTVTLSSANSSILGPQ